MKIKVPKRIKLGAYCYDLGYESNLATDKHFCGTIRFQRLKINIEPNMPESVKNVTLLHELFEGISDMYRCGLEDENCERLAQGMADFLFNSLGIEFDWSLIQEI